jgi:hypothetical protein
MYTWGYIKENTLGKLNISEEEANRLGFLSRFPYYANEAMTQICSAVKPDEKIFNVEVNKENVGKEITLPEDFVSFSDDIAYIGEDVGFGDMSYTEATDEHFTYRGYNKIICHRKGDYRIPYRARWFFFTKDLTNETIISAPADICDALPSYIASQCFKIDDEVKSAVYRNEYEMFLSRMDDTSYRAQRTFHVGGGW